MYSVKVEEEDILLLGEPEMEDFWIMNDQVHYLEIRNLLQDYLDTSIE